MQKNKIEIFLLCLIILSGFLLRVWNWNSTGVDHFDEGAYLISASGLPSGSLFSNQIKLSPPMYFSSVGLLFKITGSSSASLAVLLNIIVGTLTVLAVWWVGRMWLDPGSALGAAALLAFNEYHITLSRTGLTDIFFAFFFIVALGVAVSALKSQSIFKGIIAGILVGLAWNTKYHGWFVPFICASTIFINFILFNRTKEYLFPALKVWITMSIVAGCCYLPWALFIQSHPGGYLGLLKYHSQFTSLNWVDNLYQQLLLQKSLSGLWTQFSVIIAVSIVVLQRKTYKIDKPLVFVIGLSLLVCALIIGGGALTIILLAMISLFGFFNFKQKPSFSVLILLISFLFWFLISPVYHPYARLLLPFMIMCCLLAANGLYRFIDSIESTNGNWIYYSIAFPLVIACLIIFAESGRYYNPWRPSNSVEKTAEMILNFLPEDIPVYSIGEPSLAFYLQSLGDIPFRYIDEGQLCKQLEERNEDAYLIRGIYSKRAPSVRDCFSSLSDDLKHIGDFQMSPKDIRVLDDFKPQEISQLPFDDYNLSLYKYTK